jgi:macrodomain Ter protein organizer (MatP/YcbG family)
MANKQEARSERITLVVTPSQAARLRAYAAAHDKTLSSAIVDFLDDASRMIEGLTKLAAAVQRRRATQLGKAMGKLGAAG